jgi:hypothetical protein
LAKNSRQRPGSAPGTGKSGIPLATSQHRPHLLQYPGASMSLLFNIGVCAACCFFLHFFTSLNIAIRSLAIRMA